jgi:hypothetical protein
MASPNCSVNAENVGVRYKGDARLRSSVQTYAPVIEDTAIAPPVVALQNFWLSVGAGEVSTYGLTTSLFVLFPSRTFLEGEMLLVKP